MVKFMSPKHYFQYNANTNHCDSITQLWFFVQLFFYGANVKRMNPLHRIKTFYNKKYIYSLPHYRPPATTERKKCSHWHVPISQHHHYPGPSLHRTTAEHNNGEGSIHRTNNFFLVMVVIILVSPWPMRPIG